MQTTTLKTALSALALAVSAALFSQAQASDKLFALSYVQGTQQTLQYGTIEGLRKNGVISWLNVPYARSPVKAYRFSLPEEPVPWRGVLKTQEYGPDGIQFSGDGTKGSEDCLNLNVFRPDNDHTGLPILVYIHGGNNQTGSARDIVPENLVKKGDVIVVSVNYRLGLLGFNALPALKTADKVQASGNYAILDLGRALDFLSDNAFAFGGNPENITISGFSAGGRDVMAMLASPYLKGKFHKAISFSGGMTMADPEESAQLIAARLAPQAVKDGRAQTLEEAQRWLLSTDYDEMRAVERYLRGLEASVLARQYGDAGIRMAAFPHLYKDGTVLPTGGFARADYNEVPLIMLTGTREFSGFALSDPLFKEGVSSKQYLSDPAFAKKLDFAIDYGSELYGLFNAQESAVKMVDEYEAPIYTCAINYGNDPALVGEEMALLTGASHGIFLPFLTDAPMGPRAAYPEAFAYPGTQELTEKFMAYITNFLWTDNPNGPGLPKWQPWSDPEKGPSEMIFDADKEQAFIYQTDERTSYDEILKRLEADERLSAAEKEEIVSKVLNGRWFSRGLDEHYGNPILISY